MEKCQAPRVDKAVKTRVLIVRYSAIGDCVMAAWSVSGLRQSCPDIEITWAVQERCAPVISYPNLVDDVVLADMNAWKKRRLSPRTWRDQMAVYARMRRKGFDIGFDFQGHSKTALCLRLSGVKMRYASRGTDGLAKRLNQVVECGAGRLHEVEVGLNLLRWGFADIELPDLPIMPNVNGESFDVTVQTGAGHPDKKVSTETWKEVCQDLVKRGLKVALVGAPQDPSFELDGVVNLVGKHDLKGSMGLVKSSRVHVASDTGTGHIASAYGVRTVSVFGPTDPVIYRPWGEKSLVLKHSENPENVSVPEIIEAITNQLESSS